MKNFVNQKAAVVLKKLLRGCAQCCLLGLLCSGWGSVPQMARAADEKPLQPIQVKHQVTGLFSPDRQDDLRAVVQSLPDVQVLSIDYDNAEAVFSYDPHKLFGNGDETKLVERFDNVIRSATRGTFGIKPLRSLPKEQLQKVEIGIVGLDCKGCSLAAYESVSRMEGVEMAQASFKAGLLTAWIDPAKTNTAALEEALKQRGVEVKQPKAE